MTVSPLPRPRHAIWLLLYIAAWVLMSPVAEASDDVVWQLWIADQLNHGFALYRDFRETNPPLWFWYAQAVDALRPANMSLVTSYFLGVALAASAALAMASRLLRGLDGPEQQTWMLALATTLFGLGFFMFGQREHLCVIFGLPYVLLVSARMRGRAVSPGFAILVGVFAAGGFLLKHYFLLVPLMLEIALMVSLQRRWRPWRWETAALVLCGLIYATCALTLTPDYFSMIVPMVQLGYSAFEKDLAIFIPPTALAACGLYLALRTSVLDRATVMCVSIFSVGLWLAYVIQRKGWMYQEMPIFMPLLAVVAASAWAARRDRRTALPLAAFALTAAAYLVYFGAHNLSRPPGFPVSLGPGRKVAWIGASGSENIQHVLRSGSQWTQGYVTLWPLLTIARAQRDGLLTPPLQAMTTKLRRDVVRDMLCQQPDLILVADSAGELVYAGQKFDQLAFFTQSAAFAQFFAQFKQVATYHHIRFYARLPGPLDAPAGCRTFHPAKLFRRETPAAISVQPPAPHGPRPLP